MAHWESVEQAATQLPETQNGVAAGQVSLEVHVELDGVGSQTEFVQVNPVAHGVDELQAATHWLFAQTVPAPHWLE